MDFFQQQARARTASWRLLALFLLAVIAIIVSIDVVVLVVLQGSGGHSGRNYEPPPPAGPILFWTSAIVLATIVLSCLYKIAALSSGGAEVARSLGAAPVPPDTQDARHRRLRNVVEEMAIAAGVPAPRIFVLEDEPGINAFAAGFSPTDAAVTVTRGALDKLSRDELQGVIGHEFSHILNGDMRLNVRIMGLLFGILVLGIVGREVLYYSPRRSGRDDRGGAVLVIGISLLVLGYVGVFFGRLIKAGISRQREFLADASAVQFTRQTTGLSGALKKAAGIDAGTRLQRSNPEQVAHMLFGDGVGYSSLFATHPPMVLRIQRLDPQFRPSELAGQAIAWNAADYEPEPDADTAPALGSGTVGLAGRAFAPPEGLAVTPAAVQMQVGNFADADYASARALHREIPAEWLTAARDPHHAIELVFALLLNEAFAPRAAQLDAISDDWGATCRAVVEKFAAAPPLNPALRLPLAALAFPSLRQLPRETLRKLIATVDTLVHADHQVEVSEYCLARMLSDQLAETLSPATTRLTGNRKLDECREAIANLFSIVADRGTPDPQAARRAFLEGANAIFPTVALLYRPPPDGVSALDAALSRLDTLQGPAKSLLIEALVRVIASDGRVTLSEAELLRTICSALHCPLPPLLEDRV